MNKPYASLSFLILASFLFILQSRAETIILKSGKTVEGTIVENADTYVKIDTGGIALSYYFDDIATINGKAVSAFLSEKNTAASSLQKTISSVAAQTNVHWIDWYASTGEYMGKMQTMSIKGNLIFRQLRKELEEAGKNKDAQQLSGIAQQIRADSAALLKTVEEIQPPEELKSYHSKQVEIIQHINSFAQIFPTDDTRATFSTMRKITLSMIGACNDLKAVYTKHQAPKEFIDQLDSLVAQLNSGLQKLPKDQEAPAPADEKKTTVPDQGD